MKNRKLMIISQKSSGRDKFGHISIRHRGGGSKRKIRIISSLDIKKDLEAKVVSIDYDPGRTSLLALIEFTDKDKIYIIAPVNLKIGDKVIASNKTDIKEGNRLLLKNIPTGTQVHDIEIQPKSRGKIVKSAGSFATIFAQEDKYIQLRLPSGEIRRFLPECFASIGQVSNPKHNLKKLYKAGQNRWRGFRPTVRGKAMNVNSHPHGGGEGVSPIGLKHPKTPWGKIARGKKTRKKNHPSDKLIVTRRK